MFWSVKDFFYAIKKPSLWLYFAFSDVEVTYKKSIIGLAWISLSLGAFIAVKLLVFGSILKVDSHFYSLWVGVGFWIWHLFVSIVNDGCKSFLSARGWILGTNIPLSTYLFQVVSRSFIRFGFSFPVVIILFLIEGFLPGTSLTGCMTSVLGILTYVITGLWVAMLLATICARFRDLMHLAQTIMQVSFFLTPILYIPSQFGSRAHLFQYNPFTHYIAIVRDPLMGLQVPILSWVVVGIITMFGIFFALLIFHTLGRRTAFFVT